MLSLVLKSFFSVTLIHVVMLNLSRHTLKKLTIMLSVCVSTVLCALIVHFQPGYGFLRNMLEQRSIDPEVFYQVLASLLVTCEMGAFLICKTNEILFNIIVSAVDIILIFFSNTAEALLQRLIPDNISSVVKNWLNNPGPDSAIVYYLQFAVIAAIAFGLSRLVGNLIKRYKDVIIAGLKTRYSIFIIPFTLPLLVFFYFGTIAAPLEPDSDSLVSLAITVGFDIAFMILLSAALYVFLTNVRNTIEAAHRQELYDVMQEYTSNLEKMYDDTRKFRHDYLNIISGIYGYLQDEDLAGLSRFFSENIAPVSERMRSTNSTIDKLKNIRVPEIKGLVTLKLLQASDNGIEVYIEVPEPLDGFDINLMELARVIGILLDNAAEECEGHEGAYIHFLAARNAESVTFFIINPVHGALPSFANMFKKGFSTKGENRGLGLSNVREIINANEGAFLNTYTRESEFVQELTVPCQAVGEPVC